MRDVNLSRYDCWLRHDRDSLMNNSGNLARPDRRASENRPLEPDEPFSDCDERQAIAVYAATSHAWRGPELRTWHSSRAKSTELYHCAPLSGKRGTCVHARGSDPSSCYDCTDRVVRMLKPPYVHSRAVLHSHRAN